MAIGVQIRKYRLEAKLSQKQLGERLGMSQQQIAQYENGNRIPKIDTISNLANALDVKLDALIDFDTDGPNNYLTRPVVEMKNRVLGDASKTRQDVYDRKENILLGNYRKLNAKGQDKAIEAVEDLTYIPKYTQPELQLPDHLKPNAAHIRTGIEVTDEMKEHDEAIMDDEDF